MRDRERETQRSNELDGLRGLAALTVVFSHFYDLFPPSRWTILWKVVPLYLLSAGRESVVIFFVLSGFALHRMVIKAAPFHYHEFALRRIVRIYGPYLPALLLAIAGNFWLSHGVRSNFSDWFDHAWPLPIDWRSAWQHVAFLGEYDTTPFNGAFWSLVHEMRISLVFPVIFLLVKRRGAVWNSFFAVALVVLGSILKANIPRPNNLGETLHYSGLFIAGIYISEHQELLASWYRLQSFRLKTLLVVGALFLFCYGRLVTHFLPNGYGELLDLPVGLGAAAIIVLAFAATQFSAFLVWKPVAWLGTRSYSLYLLHGTVLLALINLLNMSHPSVLVLPLYVGLTLLLTHLFYSGVEHPLVLLSRKFTSNRRARLAKEWEPHAPVTK